MNAVSVHYVGDLAELVPEREFLQCFTISVIRIATRYP